MEYRPLDAIDYKEGMIVLRNAVNNKFIRFHDVERAYDWFSMLPDEERMIHCVNMSFEDDVQSFLYFEMESEDKNMKPKVKALIKRVTKHYENIS